MQNPISGQNQANLASRGQKRGKTKKKKKKSMFFGRRKASGAFVLFFFFCFSKVVAQNPSDVTLEWP